MGMLTNTACEPVQSYEFRRKTTHYFRTSFIFALLLLSNLQLQAYSIPEVVAKTKPAVVEIIAVDEKGATNRLGTGFFISPNGQLVTNRRVIEGASSIAAINNNGAIFVFERVVAQPVGVDLAILKFRATDVPFLTLGKSTTALKGQKVIVIGNPTGLAGTVSDGIIFAFHEKRSVIQITAPISPGSSGSPVMDENAEVIGVATKGLGGQNLNFAIAVEKVSTALLQPPSELSSGLPLTTATPTPAIDAKVCFDIGVASLGQWDYDKAISAFTEAIGLDPNYALAYVGRGEAYSTRGNFDKAISDFTEAIRLYPNNALAYNNRGNAYQNQGNLSKAISDYNDAILLDPPAALAYYNRGLLYAQKRNYDKATSDYNEAIRLDPDYAPAYVGRGYAYDDRGEFDKAISDYNEAIRLDPNYALAYKNRGFTHLRAGDRDKANADFATAKRLKAGQ